MIKKLMPLLHHLTAISWRWCRPDYRLPLMKLRF
jgi:hypothetical protein